MFEWKGKSGHGGLPHLSYIKRKPKPLGTELKSVCEGTMGMCVYIEIQKGKVAMAQKNGVTAIVRLLHVLFVFVMFLP